MTLRATDQRPPISSHGEVKLSINDPKYVGPGTWFTIHLKGRHANSPTKKREFTEFMWMIANDFKCKVCAEHCRKYLEDHPIANYYDVRSPSGEEIGCFKWAWMFHNDVNSRLGKPIVDWNTAYGMYFTDSSVCEIGCEGKGDTAKDDKTKPTSQTLTAKRPTTQRSDPEPMTVVKTRANKTPPMVYVIKGDRRSEPEVKRPVTPVFVGRRQ